MRKLLFPFLSILLFTACKKEISKDNTTEEIASAAANRTSPKITVCHYDAITGKNKTILINETAWPEHQAHGDLLGDCSAVLVKICNKDWMKKNLDVDKYRDGTTILQATTDAEWIAAGIAGIGAWCYYPETGTSYGKLYNLYAVNDPRGLAPAGWHIPSDAEWTTLENCLNEILPVGNVGGKMKSTGTIEANTGLWVAPNIEATNSSGFTGLPGGGRAVSGTFYGSVGFYGFWWSSSELSTNGAWLRYLDYSVGYLSRSRYSPRVGSSVRCLRD